MLLSGTFDDFSPADILGLLSFSRKTGALAVTGASEVTLFLHEGRLYHAETPSVTPLVTAMAASGAVDQMRWSEAFAAAGTGGIGQALVDTGVLRREELVSAVHRLLLDALAELFGMASGRFEFRIDEKHPFGPVVSFPVRTMVAHPPGVLTLSPALPGPSDEVTLTAEEWDVVSVLGDGATVVDVARALGLALGTVADVFRRLVDRGLVRGSAPPAERRSSDRPWADRTTALPEDDDVLVSTIPHPGEQERTVVSGMLRSLYEEPRA